MNPPFDAFSGQAISQHSQAVSPDAATVIGDSWGSQQNGHPQMFNLWRSAAPDTLGAASFDLLSAPSGVSVSPEVPPSNVTAGNNFAGGSEDFSHVVFTSSRRLLPEAPALYDGVDGFYLYEWSDHLLRLVNLLPNGDSHPPPWSATEARRLFPSFIRVGLQSRLMGRASFSTKRNPTGLRT